MVQSMVGTAAERIKEAARRRFLKDGFEETSMDVIAREARVSKQSMYDIYATKLDLFGAVIGEVIESVPIEIVVESVPDGSEPITVISDFVRSFFNVFLSSENLGIVRAQLVAARCFPHLAKELQDRLTFSASAMANYLASLMKDRIVQQFDPLLLTRRFGGTAVQGTRYVMGFRLPDTDEQHRLTHYTVDLLLNGYRVVASTHDWSMEADTEASALAEQARPALRISPERIDHLLNAAADEFLGQGYRGAKIEQIVRASGIGAATIYRQFGNKKGLFRQVLCHLGGALLDDDTLPRAGQTIDATLRALARWILDRHLAPGSLSFRRLIISEAERFPDVARWVYDREVAFTTAILSQRLIEFGLPAPTPLAARTFYTLATYSLRFVVTSENPDSSQRDACSAEAAMLFLYGAKIRRDAKMP